MLLQTGFDLFHCGVLAATHYNPADCVIESYSLTNRLEYNNLDHIRTAPELFRVYLNRVNKRIPSRVKTFAHTPVHWLIAFELHGGLVELESKQNIYILVKQIDTCGCFNH